MPPPIRELVVQTGYPQRVHQGRERPGAAVDREAAVEDTIVASHLTR